MYSVAEILVLFTLMLVGTIGLGEHFKKTLDSQNPTYETRAHGLQLDK
jgi:hypothetical protein